MTILLTIRTIQSVFSVISQQSHTTFITLTRWAVYVLRPPVVIYYDNIVCSLCTRSRALAASRCCTRRGGRTPWQSAASSPTAAAAEERPLSVPFMMARMQLRGGERCHCPLPLDWRVLRSQSSLRHRCLDTSARCYWWNRWELLKYVMSSVADCPAVSVCLRNGRLALLTRFWLSLGGRSLSLALVVIYQLCLVAGDIDPWIYGSTTPRDALLINYCEWDENSCSINLDFTLFKAKMLNPL